MIWRGRGALLLCLVLCTISTATPLVDLCTTEQCRGQLDVTGSRYASTADSLVALGAPDQGVVSLIDTNTGETRTIKVVVNSVSLSPAGAWLAVTTSSGEVCVWATDDLRAPRFKARILGETVLSQVAFSQDGRYLAVATPTAVHLRNASSGTPISILQGAGWASTPLVSFSPDSSLLASGDSVWETESFLRTTRHSKGEASLTSLQFRDEDTLVCAWDNGELIWVSTADATTLRKETFTPGKLLLSEGGEELAEVGPKGVRIFSVRAEVVVTAVLAENSTTALAFMENSTLICSLEGCLLWGPTPAPVSIGTPRQRTMETLHYVDMAYALGHMFVGTVDGMEVLDCRGTTPTSDSRLRPTRMQSFTSSMGTGDVHTMKTIALDTRTTYLYLLRGTHCYVADVSGVEGRLWDNPGRSREARTPYNEEIVLLDVAPMPSQGKVFFVSNRTSSYKNQYEFWVMSGTAVLANADPFLVEKEAAHDHFCRSVSASGNVLFAACGGHGLLRVHFYNGHTQALLEPDVGFVSSVRVGRAPQYTSVDCDGPVCVVLNGEVIELWDASVRGHVYLKGHMHSSFDVQAKVLSVRLAGDHVVYSSQGGIHFLNIRDKFRMHKEATSCTQCTADAAFLRSGVLASISRGDSDVTLEARTVSLPKAPSLIPENQLAVAAERSLTLQRKHFRHHVVHKGTIYVADNSMLLVFTYTKGVLEKVSEVATLPSSQSIAFLRLLRHEGHWRLVVGKVGGFNFYLLDSPNHPELVVLDDTYISLRNQVSDVAAVDSRLYVAYPNGRYDDWKIGVTYGGLCRLSTECCGVTCERETTTWHPGRCSSIAAYGTNILFACGDFGVVAYNTVADILTYFQQEVRGDLGPADSVHCQAGYCYVVSGSILQVWDATETHFTKTELKRTLSWDQAVLSVATDPQGSPQYFAVLAGSTVAVLTLSGKQLLSFTVPNAWRVTITDGVLVVAQQDVGSETLLFYDLTVYDATRTPATEAPKTLKPSVEDTAVPPSRPTDKPAVRKTAVPTEAPRTKVPKTAAPTAPPTEVPIVTASPTEVPPWSTEVPQSRTTTTPTTASPPTEPPATEPPATEPPPTKPPATEPPPTPPPATEPPTAPPRTAEPTATPTLAPPKTTVAPPSTSAPTEGPLIFTEVPLVTELAGYTPQKREEATHAARIDLDVLAIHQRLEAYDLAAARQIYENGVSGGRTLRDLAQDLADGHSETFLEYGAFWGSTAFADTLLRDAFEGRGDFSRISVAGRVEAVRYGVMQVTWLSVVKEAESAVKECSGGGVSGDAGLDSLDRAWGYYAGSLAESGGVQVMAFATQMGALFGSDITTRMLQLFNTAQQLLLQGRCSGVEEAVRAVRSQLVVPLLQGVLHNVNTVVALRTEQRGGVVLQAEDEEVGLSAAWTLASTALPLASICSRPAADSLQWQLSLRGSPLKDGVEPVRSVLESLYGCLGVRCAEVGALNGTVQSCSDGAGVFARKEIGFAMDSERLGAKGIYEDEGLVFGVVLEGARVGVPDGDVLVQVAWKGGAGLQRGGGLCGVHPCITLVTDTHPADATNGIAATSLRNAKFIRATITTLSDHTAAISIRLQDPSLRIYLPDREQLRVVLSVEAFTPMDRGGVCEAGVCSCDDGDGTIPPPGCTASITISGEPPLEDLTTPEVLATRAGGAAAVVAVSAVLPASATTGGALVRLAILSKIALCPEPEDEDEEDDPTLNPLRLQLGKTNQDTNGAVVGGLIIVATFIVLCVIALLFVRQCVSRNHVVSLNNDIVSRRTPMALMARARFGWLVVPVSFLYGGAVASGFGSIMYSDTLYKVVGVVDVVLGVLVPVYTLIALRKLPHKTVFVTQTEECFTKYALNESSSSTPSEKPFPLRTLHYLGWGAGAEWVAREDVVDSEHWYEVHRLLFDGYTQRARYFMVYEQCLTIGIAAISSWEPETKEACTVQGGVSITLLGILFLSLVGLRPYLAPYETLMDSLVAGVEAAMMVCVLVSLKVEDPAGHWSVEAVPTLAQICLILILSKFALDSTIFTIDEYSAWKEGQQKHSFLFHLFCGCLAKKSAEETDSKGNEFERCEATLYDLSKPEDGPPTEEKGIWLEEDTDEPNPPTDWTPDGGGEGGGGGGDGLFGGTLPPLPPLPSPPPSETQPSPPAEPSTGSTDEAGIEGFPLHSAQ